MSPAASQVYQTAIALPDADRQDLLAALLVADTDGDLPFDAGWQAVAERRSAELDDGSVVAESWDAVRARAHRQVGLDD